MQLIHKPEDVEQVLDMMTDLLSDNQKGIYSIENMRTQIEGMMPLVFTDGTESVKWDPWYLSIGLQAIVILTKTEELNHEEFGKFLVGKHEKYGAEPLIRWRELGILMRLDSKIQRITNLMKADYKGDTTKLCELEESIEDNLKDIIGYCVLGWWLVTTCPAHVTEAR